MNKEILIEGNLDDCKEDLGNTDCKIVYLKDLKTGKIFQEEIEYLEYGGEDLHIENARRVIAQRLVEREWLDCGEAMFDETNRLSLGCEASAKDYARLRFECLKREKEIVVTDEEYHPAISKKR